MTTWDNRMPPSKSPPKGVGRRKSSLTSFPFVVVAVLAISTLLAPYLAPYDPLTPSPGEKLLPPSIRHWFGTDPLGMDVFSRTLCATRADLTVAVVSVLLGIVVGASLGALGGYVRGGLDEVLMRFTEVMQAFPQILFAMAVFAAVGSNLTNLVLILAFLNVPVYLKMVRSSALPLRESEFILAARCAGHSTFSMVFKHILPNTLVPVFSQFSLSVAYAIQMIAGLSFIGLGVRVPQAEWGSMINLGAGYIIFGKWWPAFFPGLAAFVASYALNGLGRRLKELLVE
jgi:peptide/nickel transport system permease protein